MQAEPASPESEMANRVAGGVVRASAERKRRGGLWARFGLRRPQAAISAVPGELRVLVAQANGGLEPLHQLTASLPEGVLRAGLRAPNLADVDAVAGKLHELVEGAGALGINPGLVSLLIPDAAVRLAMVPIEGSRPRSSEGDSMARWALRDLLPIEPGHLTVDWAVLDTAGASDEGAWMLALGADRSVIGEYEQVVRGLGWNPGRVVPWTLATACGAAGADDRDSSARLVLAGVGEQLACLVEVAGIPRLHRAWRGGSMPDPLPELEKLRQYVGQRLDMPIAEAVVAGPRSWRQNAAAACEALGWSVRSISTWDAMMGALER